MSYLRSFFSVLMSGAFLFSSSLCFAGIQDENFSTSNFQKLGVEDLNVTGSSGLEAAVGPHQSSHNQLIFTFDASEQYNASGTFSGYVTFPNQVQYSVTGIIGPSGFPVSLQVGPPSLLGNYVMTFVITSISGTMDPNVGPYGTAQNLTNGDQASTSFYVINNGDQASLNFTNRL